MKSRAIDPACTMLRRRHEPAAFVTLPWISNVINLARILFSSLLPSTSRSTRLAARSLPSSDTIATSSLASLHCLNMQ
jgi:hypothetical protein